MIRVSEAVVKALQAEGIDTVFGYPGAAICPVFDSLIGSGIRSVLVRQEQNAGHAASGWARLNGKPGVCIVTSGPGATNLLTALATAYMDSIPLVAITGQVPCDQIGKDVFQEADITGAAEPFTKYSYLVKDAKIIPEVLRNAFYIASTGRPGPVLVDIPLDIQRQEIEFDYPQRVQIRGYKPPLRGHAGQIGRVASALRNAKRPLLCAGGGVILSGAQEALRLFCKQAGVPVVTTLMGLGALPAGHPLHLGMLGVHGSRRANQALHRCDLLIILGARISDRAIAATGQIAPGAQIVHIDIDTAEIGKNIGATIPLVGDARLVLQDLLEKKPAAQSQAWLQELLAQQEPEPSRTEPDGDFVNPHAFLRALSDRMQPDAVVCADVGQNQIWTASGLQLREGRLLTSGGMGTMGYSLPAALGAKLAQPQRQVIAICGDGAFQMQSMELATLRQNELDVRIVVMNNGCLGMIREIQRQQYGGRFTTIELSGGPDLPALAAAYGIPAARLARNSDIPSALDALLDAPGPFLLECVVDPQEPTLLQET